MAKHILENEIPKNIKDDDIGNSLDDFEIMPLLGKGGFGCVIKVRSKKNHKIYAMKIIDLAKLKKIDEINLMRGEIKVMKSLNSPLTVKYYNHFEIENKIYLLMEFIDNGDLCQHYLAHKQFKKAFDEMEIWELLYQSISGLCYIHQNNIIHRDIKHLNIFLTNDMKIKIGDFGFSAIRKLNEENKPEKETKCLGSSFFLSPEMIDRKPYGSKTDVYSLGCTFHELCFFAPPRKPIKNEKNIIISLEEIPINNNKDKYSEELIGIIKKMTEKDPSKRPNADQIFQEIKNEYNLRKIQCSSIFSVFRGLISFNKICDKIKEYTPTLINIQEAEKMPITFSISLALKNILPLINIKYPTIFDIREILAYYNSKFIAPGEIDCLDLIDYIIQNLFMETNHQTFCGSCHLFFEENDMDTLNRNTILNKYKQKYSNNFKSFVSDDFFGTFELNRICNQCALQRTFFENFYYLTLNVDSSIYKGFKENNENFIRNCLQSCTEILVNKFCPRCNNITIQRESKKIYAYPNNIIIYIKRDDPNCISNICYPQDFDLNEIQSSEAGYVNYNRKKYNLKAVIQQYTQNGEKLYGCTFRFNQNWFFGNGYNIMSHGNSPYDFNTNNVVMLFYSIEN